MQWQSIASAPQDQVIETKVDDERGERLVQDLIKKGSLFWLTDMSMYVYYTPTHWRAKTR